LRLALRNQEHSVTATIPVDVLPFEAVAFFRAHSSIEQDKRNIVEKCKPRREVLCFLCRGQYKFAVVLAGQHPDSRDYFDNAPLSRKAQHPAQSAQDTVYRADLQNIPR